MSHEREKKHTSQEPTATTTTISPSAPSALLSPLFSHMRNVIATVQHRLPHRLPRERGERKKEKEKTDRELAGERPLRPPPSLPPSPSLSRCHGRGRFQRRCLYDARGLSLLLALARGRRLGRPRGRGCAAQGALGAVGGLCRAPRSGADPLRVLCARLAEVRPSGKAERTTRRRKAR